MPRANRHSIPGQVWHLTHRCHKKQWLLKFKKDRLRWMHWLFKARQRYGLCILNYMVTSNHIHILVQDQGRKEIPRSMQLIAGRTAQEFNQSRNRRGAFWEDRYHATAVQTDQHLARCMTYIDLNMVRAGVVTHPSEWQFCGFHELHQPPVRRGKLDLNALLQLFEQPSLEHLAIAVNAWAMEQITQGASERQGRWSEPVMVGNEEFIRQAHKHYKCSYPGLKVVADGPSFVLREPTIPYLTLSDHQKGRLSDKTVSVQREISGFSGS